MKQEEDGAKATNFELEIEDRGHLAEAGERKKKGIKEGDGRLCCDGL